MRCARFYATRKPWWTTASAGALETCEDVAKAAVKVVFDELGLKEGPSGLATVSEERKTKALHRIYALAPIGSDFADIARRALTGIEEPGTPEDRRLDGRRRPVEQRDTK